MWNVKLEAIPEVKNETSTAKVEVLTLLPLATDDDCISVQFQLNRRSWEISTCRSGAAVRIWLIDHGYPRGFYL